MLEVRRYTAEQRDEWNRFVVASKNGTFLFDRNYMDYHADRFVDHSLMIYRNGSVYALLPANIKDDTLYSHGGLTYGGLIMSRKNSAKGVVDAFDAINNVLASEGIRKVVYKAVPWIYHQVPAEEDLFALTDVCRANIVIRDISSAVVNGMHFTESRKSGIRKARRHGIVIAESEDYAAFWHILNDNLTHKYGVKPVHSADELVLLHSRFPQNIRLFMAYENGCPLAGTVLFLTPQVLHTQYISANAEGKQKGAVDLLFDYIVNEAFSNYRYIDFGKSTSTDSAVLNEQLVFQKEGFGARAVCYDTYEWTL
jgi:hypothetical protein